MFVGLALAGCASREESCADLTPSKKASEANFAYTAEAVHVVPREVSTDWSASGTKFEELGYPKAKRLNLELLENTGYTIGFYEDYAVPLWACYYCSDKNVASPDRPKKKFKPDPRTQAKLVHEDYKASAKQSYDRGHLAPSSAIGSRYGEKAQVGTFIMSNVVPQVHKMNNGIWKSLEAAIKDKFSLINGGCWVMVGPVFESKNPKRYNGKAAIPDELFCIIISRDADDEYAHLAYIIPQDADKSDLSRYSATIREIEERTGLDFDWRLSHEKQEELETSEADRSYFGT